MEEEKLLEPIDEFITAYDKLLSRTAAKINLIVESKKVSEEDESWAMEVLRTAPNYIKAYVDARKATSNKPPEEGGDKNKKDKNLIVKNARK